jgi:hypothetical protein
MISTDGVTISVMHTRADLAERVTAKKANMARGRKEEREQTADMTEEQKHARRVEKKAAKRAAGDAENTRKKRAKLGVSRGCRLHTRCPFKSYDSLCAKWKSCLPRAFVKSSGCMSAMLIVLYVYALHLTIRSIPQAAAAKRKRRADGDGDGDAGSVRGVRLATMLFILVPF